MSRPSSSLAQPAILAVLLAAGTSSATPEIDRTAPSPSEGQGIDVAGMDRSVKPGDDFFSYANGAWVKRTAIPSDRASWGIGAEIGEKTNRRVKGLLEQAVNAPAGSEQRKVGDYYATVMDEAAIEAKGVAPLKPGLDRIAAIKDAKALARVLGEDLRADVDPLNNGETFTTRLFGMWVAADFNNPGVNVPFLLQGGLGLPERTYYLDGSPRMADLRAKYQAHVAAALKLAGLDDTAARAERVMALEMKIAGVHATREETDDVLKANNPWKRSDFAAKAPGLDWDGYFKAAGLEGAQTIIVWQPAALKGLSALVASEPVASWKDWLAFHAVDRASAYLPRRFVDESFGFYGKAMSGTPQLGERWKRGVGYTNGALGEAVGHLYVNEYFPPETKAQLQEMVKNINAAFLARIDKLDWMAPETKAKAKEKVATLYVGVGYPDKWTDYSALEVVRGDAVGNAERAARFETKRSLAKIGKPVDRTEWCMLPQVVNAVNLPVQNALNFPAGMLQPPYFDASAPAAVNYGSIGSVIGHEISHSFDDTGAQFDAQGRLRDWWTASDRAHFEASGKQLALQYDAYAPFPDLHLNGRVTLGENIADLAGLAAAHDALLLAKVPPPGKGLTTDQLFFIAFAQGWRGKAREAVVRQQVLTDGHSPREYRVATVRNMDAWYAAFGVKPGQKLFLPEKDRVRVW